MGAPNVASSPQHETKLKHEVHWNCIHLAKDEEHNFSSSHLKEKVLPKTSLLSLRPVRSMVLSSCKKAELSLTNLWDLENVVMVHRILWPPRWFDPALKGACDYLRVCNPKCGWLSNGRCKVELFVKSWQFHLASCLRHSLILNSCTGTYLEIELETHPTRILSLTWRGPFYNARKKIRGRESWTTKSSITSAAKAVHT